MLVENWKSVLLRSWTIRVAALGIVLPEVLQLIADNANSLDWLDGSTKSMIRLGCLLGVVLLRPIKQETLP